MAGNVSGTEPAPTHAQMTAQPPDPTAPAPTAPPGAASAEAVSLTAAGQASAENFPVALRILPARYRRHLYWRYSLIWTKPPVTPGRGRPR